MGWESHSERFSKFWAQNELWCTKWLDRAILNVLASFDPIRSETIFHFCSSSKWAVMHQMASESHTERFSMFWSHSEWINFSFFLKLRMSCDAPNGLREPFWTFYQVLSPFGGETNFRFFFNFRNELWCTKWLKRAILYVVYQGLSPFGAKTFSFFFKLRMSCDALNGLREPFWTF